ncbi:MAG: prephenate dehydrogenase [Anaerolineales bacterium]|nr:prephenate dehydrogenase [Anaerolineales bacterium]
MDGDGFRLEQARIAIVGLGLMGGSLALALQGRCAVLYGVDSDEATLRLAQERHLVTRAGRNPADILPEADVIILATPVDAILTLLSRLPDLAPNPCVVMDVGSTKEQILQAMARLPERFDPIGGHPLCGKEQLSLVNAEATLYRGAPFFLTPLPRTSRHALSIARQIIQAIGAQAILLEAQEHDRMLAFTSHLPFLIASALVLAVPSEAAGFIGPGFRSTARLAGTPASMMMGILRTNRSHILTALRRFRSLFDTWLSALENDDLSWQHMLDETAQRYAQLMVQK